MCIAIEIYGRKILTHYLPPPTVIGTLRGYDQLVNLVLDNARETNIKTERQLGTTVCRGTAVVMVCPEDGLEEIANPFLQVEGEEA